MQLAKRRKSWRFREHFIYNVFINISLELNLYPVSGKLIKERQRKAERERERERERVLLLVARDVIETEEESIRLGAKLPRAKMKYQGPPHGDASRANARAPPTSPDSGPTPAGGASAHQSSRTTSCSEAYTPTPSVQLKISIKWWGPCDRGRGDQASSWAYGGRQRSCSCNVLS